MANRSPLACVFVGGGLFALAMVVAGIGGAGSGRESLWLDVARYGLQLGVVVIGGGILTFVLRAVDAEREEARRRYDYTLGLFRQVAGAYGDLKGVRRRLRGYGFRGAQASSGLTDLQVDQIQAEMKILIQVQLSLEGIEREMRAGSLLRPESVKLMKGVGRYVHDIVQDWELQGHGLTSGSRVHVANMPKLQQYLSRAEDGFSSGAGRPMEEIQDDLRCALRSNSRAGSGEEASVGA